MQLVHFFSYLHETMQRQWTDVCLSDLSHPTSYYTYQSLATAIVRLHHQFEAIGLKPGDKVAIASRNCANWGVAFLAITSYKAVAVSILPDFTAEDIVSLVNHSDARLLFMGPQVSKKIDGTLMPNLIARVELDRLQQWGDPVDEAKVDDIHFPTDNFSDTALINYTSGSTGNPKGVMLSFLNLSQNVDYAVHAIPHRTGDRLLSMLPIAHMFGLMFEFLYPVCEGTQVYFLTTQPTPTSLIKAFQQVHPYMVLTVPLVIEKIIRKNIFPVIHRPLMRILWKTPGIKNVLRNKVKQELMKVFGGKLRHLIIGGAALNQEVEDCLRELGMPYCIGYGMTECGPLLAYSPWNTYVPHSCGRAITSMEFRIDSEDPQHQDGEVQVRGNCVMQGYYRNDQATREVFTDDGWMRTGDLGVLDKGGNLFLRGRSKNMILGPNGQNIYPEEIEDRINNFHYVAESLVVERDGKLVALVLPDNTSGWTEEQLNARFEANRQSLNRHLPAYSQVSRFEVVDKEFEKTPKKSIKRFLYN